MSRYDDDNEDIMEGGSDDEHYTEPGETTVCMVGGFEVMGHRLCLRSGPLNYIVGWIIELFL